MKALIEKYNVPVPRYTSYPTVPNWKDATFTAEKYVSLLEAVATDESKRGIAVYIHLPYCESLCTYCGCNTRITVNHKVEEPYVDAVLKEWAMYRVHLGTRPVIKELHLGGGTPTFFAASNLKRLIEGILSECEVAPEASFSFEAHPANTTTEHIQVLAALGFDRLSLGVQDFEPIVQKAINRKQTPEDVMRVTNEARNAGFRSVNFDLVYGLPFQTSAGVMDAIDKTIEMRPDRIAFYSYAHVPWIRPGQRAYSEADLPDPDTKLELFVAGRQRLLDAGYKAIGFDHFALPEDSLYQAYANGTVHRNFMGYTDMRTQMLIGLGVSSISDIGLAFAQNVKSVEGYMSKIESGELPLFRGHISDGQELYIRKHILNLICTLQTSFADVPEPEQSYMESCLPRLAQPERDGLVVMNDCEIRITEKGQFFVRNICAAFDRDYTAAIAGQKFSMAV